MGYGDSWVGDGPWTNVHYHKNRKSKGNGVEITFLVQNLPERTTKTQLRNAFQPFGYVSDAYVARKKDKRGNSFGFIRYVGVENIDETLVDMNTVKILEAKVSVSVAKYDKNHKKFIYTSKVFGEKAWQPKEQMQTNHQSCQGAPSRGKATVKEGLSFADLFQNGKQVNDMGAKKINISNKGPKYPLHCMGRSIHGVAKNLNTLNNLNNILESGGLENYGLSYIGGLSVLLTLGDSGRVRDIISNHSDSLSNVFSHFHVWNGEDLPLERIVSLRIIGVPVHLRDNALFDQIGGLFGTVVQESSFSWVDSNNSDSMVMVLVTPDKRIDESVIINWKERSYVVWVAEAVGVWKPELEDGYSKDDSAWKSDNGLEVNMEDDVEDGEIRIASPPAVGRNVKEAGCWPECQGSRRDSGSPSVN
ncbi:putative RNA recognition motif domain, nucleotide-binding alpha-beta plait domain superfamily [Helianthus annuus]|nr:putative RNA recognition motif domain, nucleotide-binding alpha-beta plait domain superfamily [Helianthus annuus]